MAFLSRVEYRGAFWIHFWGFFLFYGVQLSLIGVLLWRFKQIGDWKVEEMGFLYSLFLLSQGSNSFYFTGLIRFDEKVRLGEWDFYLLRPWNPLFAFLSLNIEPSALGHIFLGILALGVSAYYLDFSGNPLLFLWIFPIWIGGSLIFASIRLLIASLAFRTLSIQPLVHLFVFSSKEFLLYPISIYPPYISFFLTFILPLAFINYYPAHLFLDKEALFTPWLKYGTFPVGCGFFFLSYLFFFYQMRKYHSTGT